MDFSNMGFEQVFAGSVLMFTGGYHFGECILIESALVDFIDEHMGGDIKDLELPEKYLIDLTQDKLGLTKEQRMDSLVKDGLLSGDGNLIFLIISNLWHRGFTLSCATKPLQLPLFIKAAQFYQSEIEDLDLATHWIE